MGSSLSLQQQHRVLFQELQQDYIVEEHTPNLYHPYLKSLFERKTGKHYLLRIIPTHSTEEHLSLNELVRLKNKYKHPSIVPLHTHYCQPNNNLTHTPQIYYLLFNVNNSITLHNEINKRIAKQKFFTEQQLTEGLKNITKAINWLKKLQEKKKHQGPTNPSHGNINSQTVYYSSDRRGGTFLLSDPLIFPHSNQNFGEKYPSPEKLMLIRQQEGQQIDPFASDLFALAMTVLESSTLGKIQKIYTKNMINYDILKANIRRCPYAKLRDTLADLLLGSQASRQQYLQQNEPSPHQLSLTKIKLVSMEKHRSKSKGKSQQKIHLIKNKSKSKFNNYSQTATLTQSQSGLSESSYHVNVISPPHNNHIFIQQPQPPKQIQPFTYKTNAGPSVRFNFENQENKNPRTVYHRVVNIKNQLKTATTQQYQQKVSPSFDIQMYLTRINSRLTQLQTDIECTIKINTQNSINQDHNTTKSSFLKQPSKSLPISKLQYNSEEPQLKSVQHSQIQPTEESQLNESIFKDSLQGFVEQYEKNKQSVESMPINEANYTINESKISEANFSHERDSFEIRDDPADQEASYIVNMKGTQIQALSNLIIPEEEPSMEQSMEQSQENKPKGEYVQKSFSQGHYKGYMTNNMRNGQGAYYYTEGGYYEGSWKNNKMNGFGKLFYENDKLAYEGYWFNDCFHGRGKIYNDQPLQAPSNFNYENFDQIQKYWLSYQGDFCQDEKEGYGKLIFSNGYELKGEFHSNKPHGKGVLKGNKIQFQALWNNGTLIKKL